MRAQAPANPVRVPKAGVSRTGRPCLFYAASLPAWFENNPHRRPAVPTKAELRSYTTQQNTKAKEHLCISPKQEPN